MRKRNDKMNLTKYQALLKTVELGGITRAAEAMGCLLYTSFAGCQLFFQKIFRIFCGPFLTG